MYFLLALLFARYSPFYLCHFLFSLRVPFAVFCFFLFFFCFVFGVLFNFLDYFSPIALRLLLLFSFLVAQSLSFHPIFTQNPLSTNLNYNNSLPLSKYKKYLALRVLLLSELIRYCKIQIITIQLQPHQYDFPLKTRVANYLLTRLHIF